MKYWNNEGTYQADYTRLANELMPASGAADTLGGELIRAATRLYYDAFNNGFCNNTSGAMNFLRQYLPMSDKALKAAQLIEPCTNTGGYSDLTDDVEAALDTLIDSTVEFILNNPERAAAANPCDMFDLQEADCYYEDDYDYDDEDYDEEDYDY